MSNSASLDDLSLQLLGKQLAALTRSERRVIEAIHRHELTSQGSEVHQDDSASFGQRLADRVAAIGGSWGFIISFALVLFGWMLVNSKLFESLGITFDPYPFIFLNLMLSTLAAIQAPIIMMSQNRQAEKDRKTADQDYEINLRAELEIRRLHQKMDRLLAKLPD